MTIELTLKETLNPRHTTNTVTCSLNTCKKVNADVIKSKKIIYLNMRM